jgi:hypothetical protein
LAEFKRPVHRAELNVRRKQSRDLLADGVLIIAVEHFKPSAPMQPVRLQLLLVLNITLIKWNFVSHLYPCLLLASSPRHRPTGSSPALWPKIIRVFTASRKPPRAQRARHREPAVH